MKFKYLAILACLAFILTVAPGCVKTEEVKTQQQAQLDANAEVAKQQTVIAQLQAQLAAEQARPMPDINVIAALQQAAAVATQAENDAKAKLVEAQSKLAAMEAADRNDLGTVKQIGDFVTPLLGPFGPIGGLVQSATAGIVGLLLGRKYGKNAGYIAASTDVAVSQLPSQTLANDPAVVFDRTKIVEALVAMKAPAALIDSFKS